MVEDSGIEPLTQACKASVFPIRLIPQNLLLTIYPSLRRQQRRVYGLGGKNRTCATWSQTTGDAISLHRDITGSTGRDRTYDQLINSQLHYRCATVE